MSKHAEDTFGTPSFCSRCAGNDPNCYICGKRTVATFDTTQVAERLEAIAAEHRAKGPHCSCDLAHNVEMYAASLKSLGLLKQAYRDADVREIYDAWTPERLPGSDQLRNDSPTVVGLLSLLYQSGMKVVRRV